MVVTPKKPVKPAVRSLSAGQVGGGGVVATSSSRSSPNSASSRSSATTSSRSNATSATDNSILPAGIPPISGSGLHRKGQWVDDPFLRNIVTHAVYTAAFPDPERQFADEDHRDRHYEKSRSKWTQASITLKDRYKIHIDPENIKRHSVSYCEHILAYHTHTHHSYHTQTHEAIC